MKRFITCILVVLCLTRCDSEEDIVAVILEEPIIPENAINVSLRPTFGFGSAYGNIRTINTILCDTMNPPEREVANSSGDIVNIMCDESVLLKPNTKYYWYCKTEKDGSDFSTDVFTFTTIDTSILNENHWHWEYVLSQSDYEKQRAQEYYRYVMPTDSCFIYGEPYGFTISDDSVKNVYRSDDYLEQLPKTGAYSFSFNDVFILDWKYQFINLGTNYFASNNNSTNKITLVLKQPYSNNVVVFHKQD